MKSLMMWTVLIAVSISLQTGAKPKKGVAQKDWPKKPNIIFIFTDDLNFHAYSATGSKTIVTPHVDRIFNEGVTCPEAYCTHMVCAPSRAGVMTGRYALRYGYETLTGDGFKTGLHVDMREKFLGESLQEAGYKTGFVGKWHLGAKPEHQPNARGFDYSFNFVDKCHYWSIDMLYENGKQVKEEDLTAYEPGPEEKRRIYTMDHLTDAAVKFIDQNKDEPFFLYYSTPLTHGGWTVHPKYLPEGTDFISLKNPKGMTSENPEWPEFIDKLTIIYDGMVRSLDHQVGRMLTRLDELGLAENTIVVIANDNGGGKQLGNGPFTGSKGQFYEGGIRTPFAVRWPAVIPAGSTYDYMVSTIDLFPTFTAVAGGTMPTDREYDGFNIMPMLTGEKQGDPNRMHFWRGKIGYHIRKGNWKMHMRMDKVEMGKKFIEVHGHPCGREEPGLYDLDEVREILLFDLSKDIAEQNNVAEQYPEVVEQLKKDIIDYSKLRTFDPLYEDEPLSYYQRNHRK